MRKPSESDLLFKQTFEEYTKTKSKESKDILFNLLFECNKAMMSKMLKGVQREDFRDLVMDATIRGFPKVLRGKVRDRLVSFCYWDCLAILYDKKQQFNDKIKTFSEVNYYEYDGLSEGDNV